MKLLKFKLRLKSHLGCEVVFDCTTRTDFILAGRFDCMTPQKQHAAETEKLLREGCRQLTLDKQNGGKVNIKAVATCLTVPYTTLRARFLNAHKPRHEAHGAQQFLSPSLEQLLVKWIVHLGSTGRPLCKRTIRI